MELQRILPHQSKVYLNFVKSIYKNHPLCRDSMSGLLKEVLLEKSEICKAIKQEAYVVISGSKVIMACVLAVVDRMPEVLQMSFFEAVEPNQEAFDLLFGRAVERGRHWGCATISAGLNIHVNYGLGFLNSHYDVRQSFGMAYNPPFYHDFFEPRGFNPIELVSFKRGMSDFELPLSDRLAKRVLSRYTVRKARFDAIEDEVKLYTEVNNKAFGHHLFYFQRRDEEDLELFRDFKHLLREENLLFVEREGKAVGFMLWYPDYHELMASKESIGLGTVLKNKISGHRINTFKIVEMGVLESEQKQGAILALFHELHKIVKNRYTVCESGWILEANTDSSSFGLKWSGAPYKRYRAYVKDLSHE